MDHCKIFLTVEEDERRKAIIDSVKKLNNAGIDASCEDIDRTKIR